MSASGSFEERATGHAATATLDPPEPAREPASRTTLDTMQAAHVREPVAQRESEAADRLAELAGLLRDVARGIQEGEGGGLDRYVEQVAEQLHRLSGYLRHGDLRTLVGDAEGYARRHPGVFLGGAFLSGLLLARFLKAASGRIGDEGRDDAGETGYRARAVVGQEAYSQSAYGSRGYGDTYDDYQPAYRYGRESRERHADSTLESATPAPSWGIGRTSGASGGSAGGDVPPPQPPSSGLAIEDGREPPEKKILRRTPHMDVVPPPPLAAGEAFAVVIYADTRPARAGERAREISIDAPDDIRQFEFEVFLRTSAHFRIEGPQSQTLVLERDRPRSAPVSFALRVVEEPAHATGTPEITAYFYCRNLQSGVVSRQIEIMGVASEPSAVGSPSDTVAHDVRGVPADLQVDVLRGEGHTFDVRVRTSLLPGWHEWHSETWSLEKSTSDIVSGYMKEFVSGELSDKERLWQLVGAGKQLFKAAPEVFHRIFWELIDTGAPLESISIVSAEPHIPWELMVPIRWKSGRLEERQPLGVEFSISRWSSSDHTAPSPCIPLVDSVVVAPRDSGLEKREQEVAVVLERFPGHRVDPAAAEALNDWLSAKETTLLHFICHGKSGIKETVKLKNGQVHVYVHAESGAEQTLELENGKLLNTARLEGMKGLSRALTARRPLIFLNACEIGRLVPVLVGSGGFAQTFMELGAAAVVAPLWSVRDSIAHEIAVEFYRRVKEEPGIPFAQILRDIRAKAYAEGGGEDTYAAYCFYGDPRATAASG